MATVTVRMLLGATLASLVVAVGAFAQDKPPSQPAPSTIPTLLKPPFFPVKPVKKLPPTIILTKPSAPEAKPAEEPAPTPAPTLALPYRATTSAIEVVGAPKPPAVGAAPDFRPVRVATSAIEVIGNATAPPPPAGPFSPVRVRTDAIEVIGTN